MKSLLIVFCLWIASTQAFASGTDCSAYNAEGPDVCGYNSFCYWQPGYTLPGSCENRDPSNTHMDCSAYNAEGAQVCGYNSMCYWSDGQQMPGSCVNR